MNEETRETLLKAAEYAAEDKKIQYNKMRKITGGVLMGLGVFLAISALAVFPRDSSWGSVYAVIGGIIFTAGVYQMMFKNKYRLMYSAVCFVGILGLFIFTDYLGVSIGNQVPRFAYKKIWSEDAIIFKSPFYTAVWHNYDTENEYIELIH